MRRSTHAGMLAGSLIATFLLAFPATPAAAGLPSREEAMADAERTLPETKRYMLAGESDRFTATDAVIDEDGSRHVRFTRMIGDLPTFGADAVMHYRPDGSYADVTNALSHELRVDLKPTVTTDEAKRVAQEANRSGRGEPQSPRLAVDAVESDGRLVWDVAIGTAGEGNSTAHFIVDAVDGKLIRSYDGFRGIRSSRTVGQPFASYSGPSDPSDSLPCCEYSAQGTGAGYHVGSKVPLSTTYHAGLVVSPSNGYTLKDKGRGGNETRDAKDETNYSPASTLGFSDSDNYWSDGTLVKRATVGVDVHYGAAVTWDYYKNVLGRNGIANNGVGAKSYVHFLFPDYGGYTDNAAWIDDCFCMVYGDGGGQLNLPPITSLDVAGHEMSHGVTSATANLNYYNEAGGLNESTSDIFGTLVEFHGNNGADSPDYKIGEKIFGSSTPLRWMDDPAKDGASKSCWSNTVAGLDPHYSSGVGNHFFYLLAVGSGQSAYGNSPTCNGAPAVTGIGNTRAGKIWYQALSAYFVSTEKYAAARIDTIKAANDLYGGTECETVKAAWLAVNVGVQPNEPACAPAKTAPILNNPGNQVRKTGTAIALQISATDPIGSPLTFTGSNLPLGLSISSSGLITGTPTTAGLVHSTISVSNAADTVTTKITWVITGTSGCMPRQLVKNKGFESGSSSWTVSPASAIGQAAGAADAPYAGTYRALLGGNGVISTETLSQFVTLPSVNCGSIKLKYWLNLSTLETSTLTVFDTLKVELGAATVVTLSNLNATGGYLEKSHTIAAGYNKAVQLKYTATENSTKKTTFLLDEITVEIP